MRLRLCTFNIENLFTRLDFNAFSDARSARYLPPIINFLGDFGDGDLSKFDEFKRFLQTASLSQDDDKRQHTALAFAEADADVYALQEVDNIDALSRFMDFYVKKIGVDPYPQLVLHEGNDPRGIDVAAVARDIRPIMTRSHAFITPSWVKKEDSGKALLNAYPQAKTRAGTLRGRIFRRDCLEIEVKVGKKTVTLFNCHFKSMSGGRDASIGMRQLEALTVREIIQRKFPDPAKALWAVMGDLNDYQTLISVSRTRQADGSRNETIKPLAAGKPSGVDPLLDDGFGINTLDSLPPEDRWTHFFASGPHKTQLDYIIASPALAEKMKGKPEIIRGGMPFRVLNSATEPRFPRVGWDRPKSSDHCPVVVEFNV